MHVRKKTKIVATIGPSSESKAVLKKMIRAGLNVARLNFSHGTYEEHKAVINRVRELGEELNVAVAVLADLQGPRIRTLVKENITFHAGDILTLTDQNHADQSADITLDHPSIIDHLAVGHKILIEDGLIELSIAEKGTTIAKAVAKNSGVLKNHKGVILPDTELDLEILSEKDRNDLAFAVSEGVDYIGLSFVGSARDIEEVKEVLQKLQPDKEEQPEIVAKIERKAAVRNLREIIKASDAVMVARGDLGIETPESEVILLQKKIIAESLASAKPVIVATQMMKSMTNNPRPTRAEVSDVSNAVIDHADALMLSEETAAGEYPVETVKMMAEIIEKTESSPYDDLYKTLELNFKSDYATLVRSVYTLAKSFSTRAIVVTSLKGYTAKLISHFRPDQTLLVATQNQKVYNKLALVWGVVPYLFPAKKKMEDLPDMLIAAAKEAGDLHAGNQVAVLLGRDQEGSDIRLVGIREVR
jgi:pyruvate kinase